MANIDGIHYFSQHDGDAPDQGDCVETCLKMIDCYLTGREISISDIVKNGDGISGSTSIAGAKKAAQWLGFGLDDYTNVKPEQVKTWLASGRLIIAFINYGKLPAKYKQDTFAGCHAVLITGIDESNNSIRYADPDFWGQKREDGFMNNNKWASWNDFSGAWFSTSPLMCTNGTSLVCTKTKPTPPPLPTENFEQKYKVCESDLSTKISQVVSLEKEKATLQETIGVLQKQQEKQAEEYTLNTQILTEKIKDIETDIKEKTRAFEDLKKQMTDLGEKMSDLEEKKRELEAKLLSQDQLLIEIEAGEKQAEKYRAEITQLLAQIEKLEKKKEDEMENLFVRLFKKFINIFKIASKED